MTKKKAINKTVSFLTTISIILFSLSCCSLMPKRLETIPQEKRSELRVYKILKTTGEDFIFNRWNPGTIAGNAIEGIGAKTSNVVSVVINKTDIKRTFRESGSMKTMVIKTKDGKSYKPIFKTSEQGDKLIVFIKESISHKIYSPVSIPLSDVEKLWIKQLDIALIVFVAFISILPAFLLGLYLFGPSTWFGS